MTAFASSYMPTGGGATTRNTDVLPFPFLARPQAMTIYIRFVEMGNIVSTTIPTLLQIGILDSAVGPLLKVLGRADLSQQYDFVFTPDTGSDLRSTLGTGPSFDDIVELRCVYDGAVQLHQSINEAAETSASKSSTNVIPTAWASPTILQLNGGGNANGFIALTHLKIHRGVQSLETMRRLAGV